MGRPPAPLRFLRSLGMAYNEVVQSGWAGRPPLCDGLTEREREVLAMIGEGCSNKEITRRLCISEKTVKNHVANVFSKLHVCDPTQAALYAIRKGLVKV